MADPAISLQRSRYGRVLRPRRYPNFDYSSSFLNSVLPPYASTFSARDHSFARFAAPVPSHANSGSSPLAIQCSAFPRPQAAKEIGRASLLRVDSAAYLPVVRDAEGEQHNYGVRRRQGNILQPDDRHDAIGSRGLRAVIPRLGQARSYGRRGAVARECQ